MIEGEEKKNGLAESIIINTEKLTQSIDKQKMRPRNIKNGPTY